MNPTNPRFNRAGTLLGIWAHPDDESYLSAGVMADVVGSGGRVVVVALSDGELGFPESDTRPLSARAAERRLEMQAAMSALGVEDIRFLGLPDGSIDRMHANLLADRLDPILEEVRPDTVVTFGPDGMTGHPDHVACGLAATVACRRHGAAALLYAAKTAEWLDEWRPLHDAAGVWMAGEPRGVRDDEVAIAMDLTGAALDQKRAALAGHASQSGPIVAELGEEDYRGWIAQEVFRVPLTEEVDDAVAAADWGGPWSPSAEPWPAVLIG